MNFTDASVDRTFGGNNAASGDSNYPTPIQAGVALGMMLIVLGCLLGYCCYGVCCCRDQNQARNRNRNNRRGVNVIFTANGDMIEIEGGQSHVMKRPPDPPPSYDNLYGETAPPPEYKSLSYDDKDGNKVGDEKVFEPLDDYHIKTIEVVDENGKIIYSRCTTPTIGGEAPQAEEMILTDSASVSVIPFCPSSASFQSFARVTSDVVGDGQGTTKDGLIMIAVPPSDGGADPARDCIPSDRCDGPR